MKKQTKLTINRLCFLIGICLLVIGAAVLILWQWNIHASREKAADYVQTIHAVIPEPKGTALAERRDNTMSVLSIQGINFLGILEMPRYGTALPVCADWGSVTKYPSRLSGSVYDRTMQIGGTSQKRTV